MATKTEQLKGVSRTNMFHVDPRMLEIEEGHNARTDFGDLEGLAESIRENGVREALHIRREGDRLIVVAGERRLRAARLAIQRGAKIESVPCMLEERYANEEDHVLLMLIENSWRKDLTPLEEAEGYRRLVHYGATPATIAKRLGCADTHVKNRLLLLSASPKARAALKEGLVSMASVLELLRRFPEGNREEQDAALADAIAAGTNGHATVATVQASAARQGKKAEARKRTLRYRVVDSHQRAAKRYLKECSVKERPYYEGLLQGLRVAMGVEELPEALKGGK
jgi:ParB/RepB/Spo0J family partition protein